MPAPPPPPPPPPPAPNFGTNNSSTTPKASGNRVLLLNEIHKGAVLKKTVTNDRSAPTTGGRILGEESNVASKMPAASVVPQKSSAPKPNAMNLGDLLFKDGVPKKPSDVKKSASATSTTHSLSASTLAKEPVPVSPAKKVPLSIPNGTGSTASNSMESVGNQSRVAAIARSISQSSNAPPLPAKLPKQNSTLALSGKLPSSQPRTQFQTLRPAKTQVNMEQSKTPLRRSGSNEEIQKRPSAPPPPVMRRPGAPPPPPPPQMMRSNVVRQPTVPVTKFEAPEASTTVNNMSNGKHPGRVEAPPPSPPPRISSYLESMEQRFHFVPISELPPPPRFIGFRKDYGIVDASK